VIAVAVHGATGRMGRSVIEAVTEDPDAKLVAAFERQGNPTLGQDAGIIAGRGALGVTLDSDIERGLGAAQVVIDFSSPAAASALFPLCARRGVAIVSGTTGMDADAKAALERAAQTVPVVHAPNFSVGVNVLLWLCEQAVKLAGPEFDLEIVEMHHKRKVDAPSGTAARMAEVVARAREVDLAKIERHGRVGMVGARPNGELGVHALRGGDVVGDHTLYLAGPGEQLELTHRAHGRHIFARGALRAAHWVAGRAPGLYDMADVLGIGRG
jgi:4-hydroxy-tetrahydrodipicolinate reductase